MKFPILWQRNSLARLRAEPSRSAPTAQPAAPDAADIELYLSRAEDRALRDQPHAWIAAWRDICKRAPGAPQGPLGLGEALRTLGQLAEAETVLAEAAQRWPENEAIAAAFAMVATARQDWPAASRRWGAVRAAFPGNPGGYIEGARATRNVQGRLAADALLETGTKALPDNVEVLIEYASSAIDRQDWEASLQRWQAAVQCEPGRAVGYVGMAAALHALGRHQQIEQLTAEILPRFPTNVNLLAARANAAGARGDVAEALQRWALVRRRCPFAATGWLGAAQLLRQMARPEDAEAMLGDAVDKFPESQAALRDYAAAAEARGAWQDALTRWELFKSRFPAPDEGYLGIAAALTKLGRPADADVLLRPAIRIFPKSFRLHLLYARIGTNVADYDEAQRRWLALRQNFPKDSAGWTGAAADLRYRGHAHEAEPLLHEATQQFPADFAVRADYARCAEDRQDWAAAVARWAFTVERFPESARARIGLARAFWGGAELAERRFREKAVPEPDSEVVFAARAEFSRRARKFASAEGIWRSGLRAFPNASAFHYGLVGMLRVNGKLDEALAVVDEAVAKFPTDFDLLRMRALTLADKRHWPEALAAFSDLANRFGDGPRGKLLRGDLTHLLPLARLDQGAAAEGAAGFAIPQDLLAFSGNKQSDGSEAQTLMMRFESLGGGIAMGCEFGNVQRRYGADPLSLLRWAAIPAECLVAGLRDKFAGVGDPGQTRLEIDEAANEYFVLDRRYNIRSHTFTLVTQVEKDRFFQLQCRRLVFLRRKFLEDLAEGQRIYVYKCDPQRSQISEIFAELRFYNAGNRILFVQEETDGLRAGQVVEMEDGMFLGAVTRFSLTNVDYKLWQSICRDVVKLVDGRDGHCSAE